MRRTRRARWWRRLGGERERVITDASPTADGGLYVVSWASSGVRSGEGRDGFLTRLDDTGAVVWEFAWRDSRRPMAVTVTPAGPVAAGSSITPDPDRPDEDPPAWLAAFTADGDRRWELAYPNGTGDSFETVVATSAGVVAGGRTGRYAARTPDARERIYGTSDWLLAADGEDGTERWRERYFGTDCVSLLADGTDTLRFVGGSRVVWVASDGAEERSRYYYAETGSSDTLDSIAPGHRDGESVVAGKAWEASAANDARLLVIDDTGEPLLDRHAGLADWSNFGKDAVAVDDGYLLSGTTLLDGCSLPWLAWFDRDGTQQEFRFVVRDPDSTPELTDAGDGAPGVPESPESHPIVGRHAAVDVLVPTPDGLFAVYNERDRSQSPEQRQTWIGYLA